MGGVDETFNFALVLDPFYHLNKVFFLLFPSKAYISRWETI